MIYLDNTTDTQVIYIPRKAVESSRQTIKPVDINIDKVTVRDNMMTFNTSVKPDAFTYGYDDIEVNVEVPLGQQRITKNGQTVFRRAIGTVDVDVKATPINQDKQVVINENGTYTYSFDAGFDGIGSIEVVVDVIGGGGGGQLTFRINATPSFATIYINGEIRDTYTISYGEYVDYKVVAEGYETEAGIIKLNEDKTLNIELVRGQCIPQEVTYDMGFYPESLASETNVNLCNYDFSKLTTLSKKSIPNNSIVVSFVAELDNLTDAQRMFSGATNLNEVVLFNTDNITNMQRMFYGCKWLKSAPYMVTSNVTNMSYMFSGCEVLNMVPHYDTSKCKTITYMFQNCNFLVGPVELDLSSTTNATGIFQYCGNLTGAELKNTQNVSTWRYCFRSCGIKDMELDLTSATTIESLFYDCYALKQVHLLNTSNVKITKNMFSACILLERIGGMDWSNVEETWMAFSDCPNLKHIGVLENVKAELDFSWSPLLTFDSLSNIIGGLYDFNGEGSQTLYLHPTSIGQLTEDMLMQATGKGWNVTEKIN